VACDIQPDDSGNNLSGDIRILLSGPNEAVVADSSKTRPGTQQW